MTPETELLYLVLLSIFTAIVYPLLLIGSRGSGKIHPPAH